MDYKEGDILCVKLTGELVTVIYPENEVGVVGVRRPVISHETGISHECDYFHTYELESEEEHLNRDADAMILKFKVQQQLRKKMDKLEEEEREENKKSSVDPSLLVN